MKKKNYASIKLLLLVLPFLLTTLTIFANDFYRIYTKNEGIILKENSQVDSVKVEGAAINFYKAGAIVYTNTLTNISRITFSTPDFPEALWLVGDGSQAGWNAPRIKIERAGTGIYSADVYLGKGEFVFSTSESGWEEDVVRPAVQHQSVSLANAYVQVYTAGEDLKWEVAEAEEGKYTVTIDLKDNTISFQKQPDDIVFPARLYTVGAGSWAATENSFIPLVPVAGKPWLFVGNNIPMSEKRLMFADRTIDWWIEPAMLIRPLIDLMETSLGQTGIYPSVTDDKGWTVSKAGVYNITINLKSHIILFEEVEVNDIDVGVLLDNTNWTVEVSDEGAGEPGTRIIDGNIDTQWQSEWNPKPGLPHWAVIDMKDTQSIVKITIHRGRWSSGTKSVHLLIGDFPNISAPGWREIGFGYFAPYDNDAKMNPPLRFYLEEPVQGQYLQIYLDESNDGGGDTQIGEVYVYGAN